MNRDHNLGLELNEFKIAVGNTIEDVLYNRIKEYFESRLEMSYYYEEIQDFPLYMKELNDGDETERKRKFDIEE